MLVPPAILLLEFKSKAEMAHIPQSQDDHQITMEDSENNFQNIAEDIQMVRLVTAFVFVVVSCLVPNQSGRPLMKSIIKPVISKLMRRLPKVENRARVDAVKWLMRRLLTVARCCLIGAFLTYRMCSRRPDPTTTWR